MKYEGVIFDCDGTLVLTEHIYSQAYQSILEQNGTYLNLQDIQTKYAGKSLSIAIQEINREFGIHDPEFLEKFNEYCKIAKKTDLIATNGTIQTINHLNSQAIKHAIASNAPKEVIKENIAALPNLKLSDELMISAFCHQKYKPDPFIFELAIQKCNLNPLKTLIIEDSSSGVEAALQTNSTPIIILNGNNDHMIERYPTILKIQDMREILNYLQ